MVRIHFVSYSLIFWSAPIFLSTHIFFLAPIFLDFQAVRGLAFICRFSGKCYSTFLKLFLFICQCCAYVNIVIYLFRSWPLDNCRWLRGTQFRFHTVRPHLYCLRHELSGGTLEGSEHVTGSWYRRGETSIVLGVELNGPNLCPAQDTDNPFESHGKKSKISFFLFTLLTFSLYLPSNALLLLSSSLAVPFPPLPPLQPKLAKNLGSKCGVLVGSKKPAVFHTCTNLGAVQWGTRRNSLHCEVIWAPQREKVEGIENWNGQDF